jgi:chemotaxis methyl-accepting protein methylase
VSNSQSKVASAADTNSGAFGKSLGFFLFKSRRLWNLLPESVRQSSFGQAYGKRLNASVCLYADRRQYFATYFLRNRAELELMRRFVDGKSSGSVVKLTVVGCSKGPEVYSIAWILRRARPDLKIKIQAVDISPEILEFAKNGVYSRAEMGITPERRKENLSKPGASSNVDSLTGRDQIESLFERITDEEVKGMFEVGKDEVSIQRWLKEGIDWLVGDAGTPELRSKLGPQEIVVANRFLCHMKPPDAEKCLRNIAHLVKPGGHLFVSGVDLDVRSKVAQDLGWKPVSELMKEMHEGDTSLRGGWPLGYWSLEPMDEGRPDWKIRYASVFQIGQASDSSEELVHSRMAHGE